MTTPKPTQEILQQVMDKIDHAIIICNSEGLFTYWNDAAKQILGNYDQVKNDPEWPSQYGMFHLDDTPYTQDEVPLIKAVRGIEMKEKMRVATNDNPGGVFIEVTSGPVYDMQQRIIGGMAAFKDITQSIKIEQFVADITARLGHLSKLIQMDFFAPFTVVPKME